ncbi:biotin--[acetyl-CoA-carboxylase] ligase [Fusobacterium sp. PH5-44]|uniref:biotin--[acetyl-CoA-carboxylase] ligase n=1 Tax=unclassified Fusobacterium TaxID=2648384 RepID=UPI003D1B7B58
MDTKGKVLTFLLKHMNENVSGEKIANELNISRTAIWQVMNKLKEMGHNIESNGNKGYKYIQTDIISEEGIRHYLSTDLKNLEIKYFDEIDSTNKKAKIDAPTIQNERNVYVTGYQTDGYGRFSRSFIGKKDGGIYISIILKPSDIIENIPLITIKTAIAAKRSIDKLAKVDVKIKWVNDLFLNSKKIAGILTEGVTDYESGSISTIIIGIGINYFIEQFPEELEKIAGSIFNKNPENITRNQLIGSFLNEFFIIYSENNKEKLIEEYKKALFILGKEVTFIKNNINYSGTAINVTDNGELVIKLDNEKQMILNSGEISIKLYK